MRCSPGAAAFLGLAARFLSAGVSALHTLPFGFNPSVARDRGLIDRSVMTTPPFVGPCCRALVVVSPSFMWKVLNSLPFKTAASTKWSEDWELHLYISAIYAFIIIQHLTHTTG